MVNNFVNIENFFLPTFTLKTDCLKQNNKHCKVGLTLKSLSRVQLFVTPMDYSLPGSSVHGIFQARVLEWVAISFSRGSSQPRDWTHVSHIAGRLFTVWATREALKYKWKLLGHVSLWSQGLLEFMEFSRPEYWSG